MNEIHFNNIMRELSTMLKAAHHKPVILCIGSDRVTGDALGPLVGHMLTDVFNIGAHIYGTLSSPVTALNLRDTLSIIERKHVGSKIIAIDSCVGHKADVGAVNIFRGSLRPGAADGKVLPEVGDFSITANVTHGNHKNLYSVRLGFVYSLALSIAGSIAEVLPSKKASVSQNENPFVTTLIS